MKRLIVAAIAVALAGCQPMSGTGSGDLAQSPPEKGAVDTADAPPAVSVPANTPPDACASRGGKMLPAGRAQTMQCVVAYADAGKRCTTGSDCQGDCRVEDTPFPEAGVQAVGRCQADSRPFGCYTTVENGRATAALCVD